MEQLSPQVELANQLMDQGRSAGVIHRTIQNHSTDGKSIILGGKRAVYFGNCSYLALETDHRLKAAAKDAIDRYGIQFACSRTYASVPLYEEAENLLSQIFQKPTIAAPTTTLAHLSTIPALIRREDAVILDQQVHASVQNAVAVVKSNGTYVEMIRHNRMDMLESRLQKLQERYSRIWYMTDSVYSMFGDVAPLSTMYELLEKYESLRLYVDDAHGMSWAGARGSGYALSVLPKYHERMLLVASLVKGFGACGAAIVLPDEETRRVLLNVGPTLVFSGPLQPSTLGAIIASAKIHLTDEITERQTALASRISYFNLTARSLGLPLVAESKTPVAFIGVGGLEAGLDISRQMLDAGFLLNISSFPAVPYKNTGLRATITSYHSPQDIYEMLHALSEAINGMERRQKLQKAEIFKAFGMPA